VETGRFRSDLFHCLNNVEVRLPPLRERREDIPYLTAAFVESFAARFDKPIERVTPGAERLLMGARWTGNVRELHEVLERACTEADGRVLTERELEATMPIAPLSAITAGRQFGTLEREHIVNVLTEVRGNKRAAAERLGISRRTLYRRLERHGLMS
jgi:DNA-binding NtrC family response regulator